jgi:hypothetical protein
MKKIVVLVLAVLMVATMSVGAFAASGAFVESPSKQLAPELVSFDNESDACTAILIITAYADRAELDAAAVAALEKAYAEIAGTENLGTLDDEVAALAEELGIPAADLAVSDLFDISYSDCDTHEEHKKFTIVIKPEATTNVAAILHYTAEGWEVIPAEIKDDGTLTFESELFSPFAIMTHNGLPASCCCGWICWLIILLIVLLIIIIIVVLVRKKKKNNDKDA